MSRLACGLSWLMAAAWLVCGPTAVTAAEEYSSRPITLVAPFAAGSGTDTVSRVIAQRLSDILKATVIVENRPGANGAVGAAVAARAKPDGYTLLAGGVSTHAANPSLLKSIQYDPVKDFDPVAQLGTFPYFLFVSPEVPAKDVRELIALAKAKPNLLSFAHANALGQLSGEMLKKRTGTELVGVPYRSSPQGVTDLLAGRVSVMFVDMPAAMAQVEGGKLRVFATTTLTRSALFPQYPSMTEAGVDLFDLSAWTGIFVPKGTPPEIVAKLSAALREAIGDDATRKRLAGMGFEANWASPADFAKRVNTDLEVWATLTKEAGIEPK